MSRAKVTQKSSQDLLAELKKLVAIEKLTAFYNHDRQEKNVTIVIPNDVESFIAFLQQNHQKIFEDYQALADEETRSSQKSVYAATLRACAFIRSVSDAYDKQLFQEISRIFSGYQQENLLLARYSQDVIHVSSNLRRKKRVLEKIDISKSYNVDKLSQIIREARFVLNNMPESLIGHTIYQQALKIDQYAKESPNLSVRAAYEAVKIEEQHEVVTREAAELRAKVGQVADRLAYRLTPKEQAELELELEQLEASQEGSILDPSDLGQGPPDTDQLGKKGRGNKERKKQVLTEQQQGKEMNKQEFIQACNQDREEGNPIDFEKILAVLQNQGAVVFFNSLTPGDIDTSDKEGDAIVEAERLLEIVVALNSLLAAAERDQRLDPIFRKLLELVPPIRTSVGVDDELMSDHEEEVDDEQVRLANDIGKLVEYINTNDRLNPSRVPQELPQSLIDGDGLTPDGQRVFDALARRQFEREDVYVLGGKAANAFLNALDVKKTGFASTLSTSKAGVFKETFKSFVTEANKGIFQVAKNILDVCQQNPMGTHTFDDREEYNAKNVVQNLKIKFSIGENGTDFFKVFLKNYIEERGQEINPPSRASQASAAGQIDDDEEERLELGGIHNLDSSEIEIDPDARSEVSEEEEDLGREDSEVMINPLAFDDLASGNEAAARYIAGELAKPGVTKEGILKQAEIYLGGNTRDYNLFVRNFEAYQARMSSLKSAVSFEDQEVDLRSPEGRGRRDRPVSSSTTPLPPKPPLTKEILQKIAQDTYEEEGHDIDVDRLSTVSEEEFIMPLTPPSLFDEFLSAHKRGEDLRQFKIRSEQEFKQLHNDITEYAQNYSGYLRKGGEINSFAEGFLDAAGPALEAIDQRLQYQIAVTSSIGQDAIVSRVIFGTEEESEKAFSEITSEEIFTQTEKDLVILVENGLIDPEFAEQMQKDFEYQLDSHLPSQSPSKTPVKPTVSAEVVSQTPLPQTSAIEEDVINSVFQKPSNAVAISIEDLSDQLGDINLTQEIAASNQALVLKLNIEGGKYLVTDNDSNDYPEIAARINKVQDLVLGFDKQFHTADGKDFKIDFLPTAEGQKKDFQFCISQFDPEKEEVVSYLNADGVNAYEGALVAQKQALEEAKQVALEAARMTEIDRINGIIDEILKEPLISEICAKNGIDPQGLKETQEVKNVLASKIQKLKKYDDKIILPTIAEGLDGLLVDTNFDTEHKAYQEAQKANTNILDTFAKTKAKFEALLVNKYVADELKYQVKEILTDQGVARKEIDDLRSTRLDGYRTSVAVNNCLDNIGKLKGSLEYYQFDANVLNGLEYALRKYNAEFENSYHKLKNAFDKLGSSEGSDLNEKIARVQTLGILNKSEQFEALLSYYKGSTEIDQVQSLKLSIEKHYATSSQDFEKSFREANGKLAAEMNETVERFTSSVSSITDQRSITARKSAFGKQIDGFKERFAEISKSGVVFYREDVFAQNYAIPFNEALEQHEQYFGRLIDERKQELNTPVKLSVLQSTPSSLLGGSTNVYAAFEQDYLPTPPRRRFDFSKVAQQGSTDRGTPDLRGQGGDSLAPRRTFDFSSVAQQVSTNRVTSDLRVQGGDIDASRRRFDFSSVAKQVSTDRVTSDLRVQGGDIDASRRRFDFGSLVQKASTDRGTPENKSWVDSVSGRGSDTKSPGLL